MGPLPPFARIQGFLTNEEHVELLTWTLANSGRFSPATVVSTAEEVVDLNTRVALTTRNFGSELEWLRARFDCALSDIMLRMRIKIPPVEFIELELAAHGDRAHFAIHVDMPIGPGRRPIGGRAGRSDDRLLSAVYYYYAHPKQFTGGNLRLYRLGYQPSQTENDPDTFIEIEPTQNTLIAFPSWVAHEVRQVICPSTEFPDFRFAVNCWYCGPFKSNLEGNV